MRLSKTKRFIAAGLFSGIIAFIGGNLISSAQAYNADLPDQSTNTEYTLTKEKPKKKIYHKSHKIRTKRIQHHLSCGNKKS